MTAEAVVGQAAAELRRRLGGEPPAAALVLGSGMGGFTGRLQDVTRWPAHELPGFPAATVAGHAGEFVAGRLGGRLLLCQSGRLHPYEGHAPATVALPVRAMAGTGAGCLIVTNAAGGIRTGWAPGTLMLIADQINLTFRNPLAGRVQAGETRFPDMSDPYDPGLRALAREAARERRIPLEEGVYGGVLGPSYETPAEIGMLARLGADAVGMSTVLEVIAARAGGLRCLGLSILTNRAAGLGGGRLGHDAVLSGAAVATGVLGELLETLVARLP